MCVCVCVCARARVCICVCVNLEKYGLYDGDVQILINSMISNARFPSTILISDYLSSATVYNMFLKILLLQTTQMTEGFFKMLTESLLYCPKQAARDIGNYPK